MEIASVWTACNNVDCIVTVIAIVPVSLKHFTWVIMFLEDCVSEITFDDENNEWPKNNIWDIIEAHSMGLRVPSHWSVLHVSVSSRCGHAVPPFSGSSTTSRALVLVPPQV